MSAGKISFVVQCNLTKQPLFPLGATNYNKIVLVPAMMHAINRVIMPDISGLPLDVTLAISTFPYPNLPGVQDAFTYNEPLLLFGVVFILFVLHLYKLVDEKERSLRADMNLSGLAQILHFLSRIIPFLLTNVPYPHTSSSGN
jgi:hypothetical protein